MKRAKFVAGGTIVDLPIEYLTQQTAMSSVFDGVPMDKVDKEALIEANRSGVSWFEKADGTGLHLSVPTELIEWED